MSSGSSLSAPLSLGAEPGPAPVQEAPLMAEPAAVVLLWRELPNCWLSPKQDGPQPILHGPRREQTDR